VLAVGTALALATGSACTSGAAGAADRLGGTVAVRRVLAGPREIAVADRPAVAAVAAEAGGDRVSGEAAAPRSAQPVAPRWRWPVAPPHVITRPFSPPATAYGPGHRGVDIAADPGTQVLAPADGTVSFAGVVVDRPVVSIRHADGLVSSVEPVVPMVSAGDRVVAGQVIGTVAAEPRHEPAGGVHLGARLDGEYVDPALLLAALQHAVLLPLDP
jgi:murein DD-endopeptidase MepM/ murein hydrolase activator NlpD